MESTQSSLSRRGFLRGTAATLAASGLPLSGRGQGQAAPPASGTAKPPLIVSTWPFGKPANDRALQVLQSGGSGLDAVEQGVGVAEADPLNDSVGLAGMPNADGVVQLDACIMSGPGHKAGSVAAVEGIVHPIGVARKVMETTRHVMLVGDGARRFALRHGFKTGPKVAPEEWRAWKEWKRKKAAEAARAAGKGHDTIALVVLTADGHLYGGCSTSGLAYKIPGRVGDSPLIGGGLYVDEEVGAAGATGVGENVLRYCGTFLVVEMMRNGLSPQEACVETIRRIARMDPRGMDLAISFIAIDRKGRFGGASAGRGFEFAVTCPEYSRVMPGLALTDSWVGPTRKKPAR